MPTVVGFVESGCPFPVGFGGFFQNDPNSIYAGTTWAQKKDVFILAAGNTYPAGSTGGEAEHVLTVDEMPSHEHLFKRQQWFFSDTVARADEEDIFSWKGGTGTGGSTSYSYKGTVINSGGSQPHNNMPPYYTMPFWIRTA